MPCPSHSAEKEFCWGVRLPHLSLQTGLLYTELCRILLQDGMGWRRLQRLPHPSTVSTSAPTSVISVRDIIISPGFTPQDTKWGRWDLRAHPAAAPCHEQGHCHQTRLPKPMHHSQGCPALGLCRCSLSHCRCSVPLSQARPCPPGAPWGAGMLWDGMNEAQGKEPLTQQERAGEWELTKKKKYPQAFMALF